MIRMSLTWEDYLQLLRKVFLIILWFLQQLLYNIIILNICNKHHEYQQKLQSGSEVIKIFLCLTQMSIKFKLLINEEIAQIN